MKRKKRIFILAIILIIVIALIFTILKLTEKTDVNSDFENNKNLEDMIIQDDTPLDIFELEEPIRLEGEKEYKGLTLSNIEIQMISERECEIRASVRNDTNNMIEMQDIKIKTYDNAGNLIDVLGAQIDSVESGGHTELYALVRKNDISNIARIEIEEN